MLKRNVNGPSFCKTANEIHIYYIQGLDDRSCRFSRNQKNSFDPVPVACHCPPRLGIFVFTAAVLSEFFRHYTHA